MATYTGISWLQSNPLASGDYLYVSWAPSGLEVVSINTKGELSWEYNGRKGAIPSDIYKNASPEGSFQSTWNASPTFLYDDIYYKFVCAVLFYGTTATYFSSPFGSVTCTPSDTAYYRFFLIYEKPKVSVTLDPTLGTLPSGTTNPISVTVGEPYGTLPTPSVTGVSGVEFLGWYTDRYSGDKVESTTIVENTSAHTLYAHWNSSPDFTIVVSFNSDGGTTPSPSSKTLTISVDDITTYGTLPTVTKSGYLFSGWHTPSGDKVDSSTIVTIMNDHTLTAYWSAGNLIYYPATGQLIYDDLRPVRW